jgi:hypothetical protein
MTARITVSRVALGLAAGLAVAAGAPAASAAPGGPLGVGNPPSQPATGMVYRGLQFETSGRCALAYQVLFTRGCTHGPDEPPAGADVKSTPAPLTAAAGASGDVQCDGDGSSGKRVQVLYVRAANVASRYSTYVASFRAWAADMDRIYRQSAAETFGMRHVRFVTDAACNLVIPEVVISAGADADFGSSTNALAALGYNRSDRKYVMFVDANVYCGIGNVLGDDSAAASNLNNGGPSYARVDAGCWGGPTAAHELMHNIGGVQLSAPHSSGGWHCTDEYDRMCYSDYPYYPPMQYLCTDPAHDRLFDCNHDDYYSTSPPAGSYLATHWNAANSQYLVSAAQRLYGYVWANQPTTASYTPSAPYQRNSTGLANTIARIAVGRYAVTFTNLAWWGGNGGTVDVTAYGAAADACKVGSWGPSGADLVVYVNCFDSAGAPADAYFDAAYTRPVGNPGHLAYVWANSPTSASYTPSALYQYNSTGATNTITRSGLGLYRLHLPGLGAASGTVKVTAYGSASTQCKVVNWYPVGTEQDVNIRCFSAAGALADSYFTATFADHISILGNGQSSGYAWIDNPTASSTPSLLYQFDSAGGTVTMARSGVGVYAVTMPNLGSPLGTLGGHAQATAYGTDDSRCKVASWASVFTSNATVNVRCFSSSGGPIDTRFVVDFTR